MGGGFPWQEAAVLAGITRACISFVRCLCANTMLSMFDCLVYGVTADGTTADKVMFTCWCRSSESECFACSFGVGGGGVCGGGLPAVWTVMSQIFVLSVQTVWHPFFFPAERHAGLLLVRNPLRWSLPSTCYLDQSLRAYRMPVTYFSVISGKLSINISSSFTPPARSIFRFFVFTCFSALHSSPLTSNLWGIAL